MAVWLNPWGNQTPLKKTQGELNLLLIMVRLYQDLLENVVFCECVHSFR